MVSTNSTLRGGIVVSLFTFSNFRNNKKELIGDKFVPKLMKETVLGSYRGLLMPRNHFLFDAFNNVVKRLFEAGIIQKWIQPYYDDSKLTSEPQGPVVLNFDHLKVGFQLWFGCLLVASLVFSFETVRESIKNRLEKFCREKILKPMGLIA